MRPPKLPEERDLVPYEASRFDARKVLVLAPHPDDEVFGCGGAMADLAGRGAWIEVLLVTDGAASASSAQERARVAAARAAESRAALGVLGGGVVHEGGLPDRSLGGRPEELEALLARRLSESGPDLVFAPSPVETHPDHRAVAAALFALAARGNGDAGARALRDATVAFYEVSQPFRPNFLFDLTPVFDLKEKAFRAFVSQEAVLDYSALVRGLNEYRKMTLPKGTRAAEGFAVFSGAKLARPDDVLGQLLPRVPEISRTALQSLRVLFSGRLA